MEPGLFLRICPTSAKQQCETNDAHPLHPLTRTHFQRTSSDVADATCSGEAALHTGTTEGQCKTVSRNPAPALPGQGSPAARRVAAKLVGKSLLPAAWKAWVRIQTPSVSHENVHRHLSGLV